MNKVLVDLLESDQIIAAYKYAAQNLQKLNRLNVAEAFERNSKFMEAYRHLASINNSLIGSLRIMRLQSTTPEYKNIDLSEYHKNNIERINRWLTTSDTCKELMYTYENIFTSEIKLKKNSNYLFDCFPSLKSIYNKYDNDYQQADEMVYQVISHICIKKSLHLKSPNSGKVIVSNRTLEPNVFIFDKGEIILVKIQFDRHPPYIGRPLIYMPKDNLYISCDIGPRGNLSISYTNGLLEKLIVYLIENTSIKNNYKVKVTFNSKQISHSLYNNLSLLVKLNSIKQIHSDEDIIINAYNLAKSPWPVSIITKVNEDNMDANADIELKPQGCYVSNELSSKIVDVGVGAMRKYAPKNIISSIDSLKSKFPVVLICIRLENSTKGVIQQPRVMPMNQIEQYIDLFRHLKCIYPNVACIIDGAVGASWDEYQIDQDLLEPFEYITSPLIKYFESVEIKYVNNIGRPMYQNLYSDRFVDIFVAPLGSSLTRLVWVSNLNGIVYYTPELLCSPNQRIWSGENNSSNHSAYSQSSSKLRYLGAYGVNGQIDQHDLYDECLSLLPYTKRALM